MRRIGRLLSCAAFLISICASNSSRATTVLKLSDQDLVRLSSTVVEGRVTGVRSEWNRDYTQIVTTVTISVDETLKGGAPANGQITLRLLGGTVGDVTLHIAGQPVFTPDENVIVFVAGNARSMTPVTGLEQGKLTVTTDAITGQRMVSGRSTRDAFVSDISRIVDEQEVR